MAVEKDWICIEIKDSFSILKEVCEQPKYSTNYIRMYEFIMPTVTDYWGKLGQYDWADEIERTILKLLLCNRRLGGVHEALYEMVWNERQRDVCAKTDDSFRLCKHWLNQCITFSELCENSWRTDIYKEKLKEY